MLTQQSSLNKLQKIRSQEQLSKRDEYLKQDKRRRTKIICSVNEQTNQYEIIKEMICAGADSLSINAAYIISRNQLKKLSETRKALEEELQKTIPLNLILRGSLNRVGKLSKPDIYLKKDQLIRLCSFHRIIGDENIIPIDQQYLFENSQIGNSIYIDYGQVELLIVDIETIEECYSQLQELDQQRYPYSMFQKKSKRLSNPNSDTQEDDEYYQNSSEQIQTQYSEIKSRLQETLQEHKKQKIQKVKILVCKIKNDCILRAYKPVYLYDSEKQSFDDQIVDGKVILEKDEQASYMDDGIQESHITNRDIGDISYAKKFGFDSITISGISRPEDVNELRTLIGQDSSQIKIFVRITRKQAVQNFQQIMKEADAIIIARAYIAIEETIQDVIQQQSEMISMCSISMKPVFVSTQILESMLTFDAPSFTEIGDISNIVRQGIDGIALSSETTYGNHPIEVIKTLKRACIKAETLEFQNQEIHFNQLQIQWLNQFQRRSISSVLSITAVETAFKLQARLIVAFTSRGETAIKLSKLRPPCQVIAVTSQLNICRFLNNVSGVLPLYFGTLYGREILIQKIKQIIIQSGWAEAKDYIIFLLGTNEHLKYKTDTIQIIQL